MNRITLLAAALLSPLAVHAQSLPEPLAGLGLTDIRDSIDDGERRIGGRLPDGSEMRIEYNRDGRIDEVETNRDGALPAGFVASILPAGLLETPEYKGIIRVTEVEIDRDEVKVEGFAADGSRIEIEAAPDGVIHSFERKMDRDRRAMTDTAARERVTDLGYTQPAHIRSGGRWTDVEATNPQGERVEVRMDEQGRVTRERAVN